MIDRAVIDSILRYGVQAPSGDNSQPWSFRVQGDTVVVFAHSEQDHPLLNVEGRGTYLATGALLENISIAAKEQGLHAQIVVGLDGDGEVARIALRENIAAGHERFTAISQRHTHRGPYRTEISRRILEALAVRPEAGCRIVIISDPNKIRRIANAASVMEETALSNQELHRLFFRSILWSKKDNDAGEPGLYIRTTELPPPVQGLFRLIRNWNFMQMLHALGFPAFAAHSNAVVYGRSGAVVAIIVEHTRPKDFIAAGRSMQRVWLEATHHGLSAQPLAGLLYLAEYVRTGDGTVISASHKARVLDAQHSIVESVAPGDGTIAMLLRVGTPLKKASARSQRREPHFV